MVILHPCCGIMQSQTHQTHDLVKVSRCKDSCFLSVETVPTMHHFSGKKLGVKTRNTFLEGRRLRGFIQRLSTFTRRPGKVMTLKWDLAVDGHNSGKCSGWWPLDLINMESYRTSHPQMSSMYHPIEICRAQSAPKTGVQQGKAKVAPSTQTSTSHQIPNPIQISWPCIKKIGTSPIVPQLDPTWFKKINSFPGSRKVNCLLSERLLSWNQPDSP